MKLKILAAILPLLAILALVAPAFAVEGPQMKTLQYKFYATDAALFTGLQNNEIDMAAWPITYDQYQLAKDDPNLIVAPYYDVGSYELAFNNNRTASGVAGAGGYRNMYNYTEFRQAVALLTDKDGLLANPPVNGFGSRMDVEIPYPALNDWIDFDYMKYGPSGELLDNYPWDYDPVAAAALLDSAGFVQGTTANPYYDSGTAWSAQFLRVYPAGHEKAGADLDPTVFCIRSDHLGRLQLGRNVRDAMRLMGLPVNPVEGPSFGTRVMAQYNYHIYTAGWSLGRTPLAFYSFFNEIGIYPYGANFYLVQDPEMNAATDALYPECVSIPDAHIAADECQRLETEKAYNVPVYTSASYYAYRKGLLGVAATKGYGLTTALDIPLLNSRHADFPAVSNIRYGTKSPPNLINPLFSQWLWDYEVIDRIFTGPMGLNNYKISVGKSSTGGDLPWMLYDWQLDNLGPGGNTRVTYWFRDDITWHDGTPFTVDDFNYTIFLGAYYDDSWGYPDFVHVTTFEKLDDYTCRITYDGPSFWFLYTPLYDLVPEHTYNLIPLPDPLDPDFYTYGHHGYWPGKDDPNVNGTIADEPDLFWIGTNMWAYVHGSHTEGVGGGITLESYDGFWMSLVVGEMDFAYKWNAGAAPQGGSYTIGLTDLVLFAKAYGTRGDGAVPKIVPGETGAWNPGADLAGPSGVVGLTDLVTLANAYGDTWGQNP
jgi:ABC-type transport system substrate-binding protein